MASNYTLWCRVWPPDHGVGSFRVALNGGNEIVLSAEGSGFRNTWRWVRASEKPFYMDAGSHEFIFKVLQADLWLDELILSNDPAWVPED